MYNCIDIIFCLKKKKKQNRTNTKLYNKKYFKKNTKLLFTPVIHWNGPRWLHVSIPMPRVRICQDDLQQQKQRGNNLSLIDCRAHVRPLPSSLPPPQPPPKTTNRNIQNTTLYVYYIFPTDTDEIIIVGCTYTKTVQQNNTARVVTKQYCILSHAEFRISRWYRHIPEHV